MKKLVIIAFIMTCFSSVAFSQFTIGPKIGISYTDLAISESSLVESGDAQVGFHAGVFTRFTANNFYLQPEAMFTSAGGRVVVEDNVTGNFDQITELTYNKLDVPVMAGIKFGDIFRVNAGPVLSLILSQDARELDNTLVEIESDYNRAVIGYQAGVGLDAGNVTLDVRYEGNLSQLGDSVNIGNQSFNTDMRNNLIILSLGLKLF